MKNLKTYHLSFLLMAVLLHLVMTSYGQAWQKNYGGDVVFGDVEQTIDGGFVSVGSASSVVFKVNGSGQEIWGYSVPSIYEYVNSQSVEVLGDGSIVAVGQAYISTPSFQQYLFLVKLDNAGNVIWEHFYQVANGSVGPFLISTSSSGGFFIGGQYNFLMKADDDGNELWRITSGGMRGLEATTDGGAVYLVNDNTTASDNLIVRKVNANGFIQWQKSYAGNNNLVGRQMTKTSDGGFTFTGFDHDGGAADYFILKINAVGDLEFLRHFGTNQNDVGQGIDQTQDGGYLVTGWSHVGGRITHLTRLNAQGDVLWERNYGAGEGLAVKEVGNGNIIMAARGVLLFYLNSDGSVFENVIKGNILEDLNADCNFQAGELGLEGWTVWANGPIRNFGRTDMFGNFEIEVDTGSYEVQPSIPGFVWQPCEPLLTASFVSEPDTNIVGPFLMQSVTATMVTISGYIYEDLNGNCQQDPGEMGIPNCPLIAADEPNWGNGFPQYTTTSDADGFYSFTVPAGEYYGVGLTNINNNPACSTCGFEFFEYVEAVPVTNNIGMQCLNGPPQHVSGFVFFDENENCMVDVGENGMTGWQLDIVKQGSMDTMKMDGILSSNGEFSASLDTGTYYFIITPPNYLFLPCQTVQVVQVLPGGTLPVLFPLMPFAECPKMTVDVGTSFIRPCMESKYVVQYCNEGTSLAEDAYVEITLPPDLVMGSSAIPSTPISNGVFSFDLGDMQPGECQNFWFNATLVCDSELGMTHCVEAHIYPDSICTDTAMFWDGSSVEVFANCDGDSVILTIMNNGWGDMAQPLEFIVVEDNVLIRDSTFQLDSDGSTNVVIYPNGSTIVLQAQQSFGHPGNSSPVVIVEGCGGDSISIGFVTQYPQNDADCFIDIDCRESVNSFDPNIKVAQPKGITAAHYITPETDLDYQITFQNLGTAPALDVIILDTLSQLLDTATLRVGVSSHDYNWELLSGNILKFTFEDINLLHASLDSTQSIGFVKYHIAQKNGNTAGTVIENSAGIYFDFNAPVITNTVVHRIPEPELFKTENINVCSGELFNGSLITENTILTDTVRYAFFDSIFIYEINVLPVFETNVEAEICEEEEFVFNGEVLTNAGVYTAELIGGNGCDSLVMLDLEVFPDLSEIIDTAVMTGSEIFGVLVFSDTTFIQDMIDENGCFYTVTYNVEIIVSTIDVLGNAAINISPNPNNGNFILKGQLPAAGKVSGIIYNVFGQEIKIVFKKESLNKNFTKEIYGANISSGTYYFLLRGDGWEVVKKLVVLK